MTDTQDQNTIRFSMCYGQAHSSSFSLDVDLLLPSRGIIGVLGHSGSGKTSFLRGISGLDPVTNGFIRISGSDWVNGKTELPTHKRPVGYVFQEARMLAHLTVMGNLQFSIKRAVVQPDAQQLDQLIKLMGITPLLERYVHELSGGELQRVAIVRALLRNPAMLLMDEPLSSLDHRRKQDLLPYIESLKHSLQIPIIYVSHSLDEVARLSDHVLVFEQGKVIMQGEVTDILSSLAFSQSTDYDTSTLLEGKVIERDEQWHLCKVQCDGFHLWIKDAGEPVNTPLRLRILARDVSLANESDGQSSIINRLPVTLASVEECEDEAMSVVQVKLGNRHILANITRKSAQLLKLSEGQSLIAQIKSVAIVHE